MKYENFSQLINSLRSYKSTSVLEVGTRYCWEVWKTEGIDELHSAKLKAKRAFAVRIMLMASSGNPHRKGEISSQQFEQFVKDYYAWEHHSIADIKFLYEEAKEILDSIVAREQKNQGSINRRTRSLSSFVSVENIFHKTPLLFLQRQNSFLNTKAGHLREQVLRTIRFIHNIDEKLTGKLSENLTRATNLEPSIYFRHFLACLLIFEDPISGIGRYDFSWTLPIDQEVREDGITQESLESFVKYNSRLFHSEDESSFRSRFRKRIENTPEKYKPFFYNLFLDTPIIDLEGYYCLPDPTSLLQSSWNQIKDFVDSKILSAPFEDYVESILLPPLNPISITKIPENKSPTGDHEQRSDFLVELENSYILIECKVSLADPDAIACFTPQGLAALWYRTHSAVKQISATIKAFNLDKPTIPLILTFYDSNSLFSVFKEVVITTDYLSSLNLSIPPVVLSLHEFEREFYNRSLQNWAQSILQPEKSTVQPDNLGHSYRHLEDVSNSFLNRH